MIYSTEIGLKICAANFHNLQVRKDIHFRNQNYKVMKLLLRVLDSGLILYACGVYKENEVSETAKVGDLDVGNSKTNVEKSNNGLLISKPISKKQIWSACQI